MSVLKQLASALNRRDEIPNQELAKKIANKNDKAAVQELIENLHHKDKNIQHDCIKVLYEIGEKKPALIVEYIKEFIILLSNKNNRLQWGAMAALDSIVLENPKKIYSYLTKIIQAAEQGSVITKDHAVNILIKLCSIKKYHDSSFSLLIEQLIDCPTNQLPMYAEKTVAIIVNDKNKFFFIKALTARLDEIEKDSKRKRIEKVISKLNQK